LYFSDVKNIAKFLDYGSKIATVTLPDDASVHADQKGDKWKADKIILSNIVPIGESELCKFALSHDGLVLRYVSTKTEEICKIAVGQNGCALWYVPEEMKTEEICKFAIARTGMALCYVPDEMKIEICKFAIKQGGNVLRYVKDEMKTEEICKIAVAQTRLRSSVREKTDGRDL
jgi:exosome complex RNA-binding protein Rrp4